MRDDFCVFILTHKRPDNVRTLKALRQSGYTGKVLLVVDDQDDTAEQYRENFGAENVYVFPKKETKTDPGINDGSYRGVVFARNASFDIAKELGYKYFLQLDDDYGGFYIKYDSLLNYAGSGIKIRKSIDGVFGEFINYLEKSNAHTIAMAQTGDYTGGGASLMSGGAIKIASRRKAMNSFFCRTDRAFEFSGLINEDVTAYVTEGRRGKLFLTIMQAFLVQQQTQKQPGGLTELYLDAGTYVKSFYSVMYAPSCVKITVMGNDCAENNSRYRIHHHIKQNNAYPKIIREAHRKAVRA